MFVTKQLDQLEKRSLRYYCGTTLPHPTSSTWSVAPIAPSCMHIIISLYGDSSEDQLEISAVLLFRVQLVQLRVVLERHVNSSIMYTHHYFYIWWFIRRSVRETISEVLVFPLLWRSFSAEKLNLTCWKLRNYSFMISKIVLWLDYSNSKQCRVVF